MDAVRACWDQLRGTLDLWVLGVTSRLQAVSGVCALGLAVSARTSYTNATLAFDIELGSIR